MLPLELYWSGLFLRYVPESKPLDRSVVEALEDTAANTGGLASSRGHHRSSLS